MLLRAFFFRFLQNGENSSQTFFFFNHWCYYQVVVVTWEQDLGQPDRTVGGRTDGRTDVYDEEQSVASTAHTKRNTIRAHLLLCSFFASRPSLALVVSSSSSLRTIEEEEEEEEQEKVSSPVSSQSLVFS
jgi:hypothetical protein